MKRCSNCVALIQQEEEEEEEEEERKIKGERVGSRAIKSLMCDLVKQTCEPLNDNKAAN
jgi:hypothetical protein